MYLLENDPEATTGWIISMIVIIVIFVSPWFYVIFKYGIFRKLRVSYIINDEIRLTPVYLKKNSEIPLPSLPEDLNLELEGWYIDEERTEKYIPMPMPNKNIKLYAKTIKK